MPSIKGYLSSKIIFHQSLSCSKVFFHQGSSSIKYHLSSKTIFHQRPYSIKPVTLPYARSERGLLSLLLLLIFSWQGELSLSQHRSGVWQKIPSNPCVNVCFPRDRYCSEPKRNDSNVLRLSVCICQESLARHSPPEEQWTLLWWNNSKDFFKNQLVDSFQYIDTAIYTQTIGIKVQGDS